MSYHDEYEHGPSVDPTLLFTACCSDYLGADYLPPGAEDTSRSQWLCEPLSDIFGGLATRRWPDASDPTVADTKPTSSSTNRSQRRQSSFSARKRSVSGAAEVPAATRSDDDGAQKLNMRKRNRLAASRSRIKKSNEIKHLEEKERLVSVKRECLSAYMAGLQREVFELNNMLLAHRKCDCITIQKYFLVRKCISGSDDGTGCSSGRESMEPGESRPTQEQCHDSTTMF